MRRREKKGEGGEREMKEEREVRWLMGEGHRPASSACAGEVGRALPVGGGSIRSWIGSCEEAGAWARGTGRCTPPHPLGADGGISGWATDGGISWWATDGSLSRWPTTPAAGAIPMDSGTA